MKVDGKEYEWKSSIQCVHGSGDNREEWTYEVHEGPNGERVLFNKDKEKTYLYLPVDGTLDASQIGLTYESCPADSIKSSVGIEHSDATLTWVGITTRFEDAPEPFTSTNQAMTIVSSGKSELYLSVAILERDGQYYSARYPADKLPEIELEEHKPSSLAPALELLTAFFLLSLLGYGAYSGVPGPLRAFWWSSAVVPLFYVFASPGGWLHDALRLWAGAFFLHFSTHLLDTVVTSDYWEEPAAYGFESIHAVLIVLGLVILRYTWLRGYCILTDAGFKGGGCAWLFFTVGLAFYSAMEEYSYFPWYRWYSGYTFWGGLWLVFLLYALRGRYQDYRRTPLTHADFVAQLHQLHRILDSGVAACSANSEELVRLCDDMEDAVRMSIDRRVAALRELGHSFLELKKAFENLPQSGELNEKDQALVTSDLTVVAADLGRLLTGSDKWGEGFQFKKLRVSTFLLTYDW